MEYAQLNEACTEAIQVTTHGNVEWDENNFCSAETLTRDGKADQFRVVPLIVTEPPTFNPFTHTVTRDGCELVDGQWQYKWRVASLDVETIAANQAAKAVRDREAAKAARAAAVDNIKVTTQAGNTFDGDEESQARISRAVLILSTGFASEVPWVLADNTVIQADAAELTEALALSGQAQAALWTI